jgi:WhiB family redox-sensing transcriptional regulator
MPLSTSPRPARNDIQWFQRGACRRSDLDIDHWFDPNTKGPAARKARKVCATCPVATECLADALSREERHGIWGGYDQYERRALLTAPQENPCSTTP